MQINKYENEEAWKSARLGKITGTMLKDVIVKRGTNNKLGFYQLVADMIALPPDLDESPMDRGKRLEAEAIEKLKDVTGLDFQQVDNEIWSHDSDERIAISPDAYVPSDVIRTAAETKSPGSAKFLLFVDKDEVPLEYEDQVLQYFIVNPDLRELYFCMYDDRIPAKNFHYVVVKREDYGERLQKFLDFQLKTLGEIDLMIDKLAF